MHIAIELIYLLFKSNSFQFTLTVNAILMNCFMDNDTSAFSSDGVIGVALVHCGLVQSM